MDAWRSEESNGRNTGGIIDNKSALEQHRKKISVFNAMLAVDEIVML